jgi:signal transduction histidine kinase
MAPPDKDVSEGSILWELIANQYQAIVLGGTALASALTLNPLPLVLWLGTQLVLLPVLDSGPLRRLVARRKRDIARAQAAERRKTLIATFDAAHAKRYVALEQLCRTIESNYQSLSGISQAYLSEQRGKLDNILEGCLNRMLALQRYEKMSINRNPADIKREIAGLEQELKESGLNERAHAALQNNLDLKRRLLSSYSEAGGNMKAMATELDSMSSLLEVLYQNSISLRDPQAISAELDTIVRQSEDSEKIVREMESLLRTDAGAWGTDVSQEQVPQAPQRVGPGPPPPPPQQRVKTR